MAETTITDPAFMVVCGGNGQITVFQVNGAVAATMLNQLFTGQRDICRGGQTS